MHALVCEKAWTLCSLRLTRIHDCLLLISGTSMVAWEYRGSAQNYQIEEELNFEYIMIEEIK